MTRIDSDIIAQIDALQIQYLAALDSQDMEGWLETFAEAEGASYICTSKENEDRNLPVALMLDDCRARLHDRVTFVTKIWAGTFQNYQTRHFVQRLRAEPRADGGLAVTSNFTVISTPEDSGASDVLVAGVYQDVLVQTDKGLRILSRKAVLDTSIPSRYLVYPV